MKYYNIATNQPMHVLFIDLVNRHLRHNLYKPLVNLNNLIEGTIEKQSQSLEKISTEVFEKGKLYITLKTFHKQIFKLKENQKISYF